MTPDIMILCLTIAASAGGVAWRLGSGFSGLDRRIDGVEHRLSKVEADIHDIRADIRSINEHLRRREEEGAAA